MSQVLVLTDLQANMLNAILTPYMERQQMIKKLAERMEIVHTLEFSEEFAKMQRVVEEQEKAAVLVDFLQEKVLGVFSNKKEAQKYVESFKSEDHRETWVHDVMNHADEEWDVQEVE